MLFPERRVYIYFAFPVRARTLALILAAVYVFNSLAAGRLGLPMLAGFACGATYFFAVARSVQWIKRARRGLVEKAAFDPAQIMTKVPLEQLERHARSIVERRADDDAITEEERLFIEELIQRVDPAKELCSPDPESGDDGMCPICKELGVCLRRFLETRKTIPSGKGR